MLSVAVFFVPSVFMLSVVMLNIIMLSVVAPFVSAIENTLDYPCRFKSNFTKKKFKIFIGHAQ
jgi:hypothetical protein